MMSGNRLKSILSVMLAISMVVSVIPLLSLNVTATGQAEEEIPEANTTNEEVTGVPSSEIPFQEPEDFPGDPFTRDLAVLDITFEEGLIVYEYNTTVHATIESTGMLFHRPADIGFYIDEINEEHLIEMLNVTFEDYTLDVCVNWTPDETGEHVFYVVADPYDNSNETDETNNILSTSVEVIDVEYQIEKAKNQADDIKDYIDSVLDNHTANRLNAKLENIKTMLDNALQKYNQGNIPQAIQFVNLAEDDSLALMDKIDVLRKNGKLTDEEADSLIQMLKDLTNTMIDSSCVMNYSDESWNLANAEHLLMEIIAESHIQTPNNPWWKFVDSKLDSSFDSYQTAVEKWGGGNDYSQELQEAYEDLLDAIDRIEFLVSGGKIPTEFGDWAIEQIKCIILIHPPDLAVSMFDIDVDGGLFINERNVITVTVHNTGFVTPSDVDVEVYDVPRGKTAALIHSTTLSEVQAKGETSLNFDWTPTSVGVHYINVMVDPQNEIMDGEETNNIVESGVSVLSGTINWIGGYTVYNGTPEWFNHTDINMTLGNLYIEENTTLYFNNTILRIDSATPGQYGIYLNNTGCFDIYNKSSIVSFEQANGYKFISHGWLNVTNSEVWWPYGDASSSESPGGIQLYSDSEANLEYCNVTEPRTHGIYSDGAKLTIIGGNITEAGAGGVLGDGIRICEDTKADIGYVLVDNSEDDGIYIDGSYPKIENATITNSSNVGISISDADEFNPWGEPEYSSGTDLGYFIWLDDDGWHIRWSGDGATHTYIGEISFCNLTESINSTAINLDASDNYVTTGELIYFDAKEDTADEGFDFSFSGDYVKFDLWLDDEQMESDVFIALSSLNPSSVPFTLSPPLEIVNCSLHYNSIKGIYICDSSPLIRNNEITDGTGIDIQNTDTAIITQNNISQCGNGIYIMYATNSYSQVINNTIEDCTRGLSGKFGDTLITHNNLNSNDYHFYASLSDLIAKHNVMSNHKYIAIFIDQPSQLIITDNTIEGPGVDGVKFLDFGGELYLVANNTFTNLSGCAVGAGRMGGPVITRDNEITNCTVGVNYGWDMSKDMIINNNIVDTLCGINVAGGLSTHKVEYLLIANNTISVGDWSGPTQTPIGIKEDSKTYQTRIVNNTIHDFDYAIQSGLTSYITENTLYNNTIGIYCEKSGSFVFNNNITDNHQGIFVDDKAGEYTKKLFCNNAVFQGISFPVGGGESSTTINLPKNAIISHASMDMDMGLTLLRDAPDASDVIAAGEFNSDGYDDLLSYNVYNFSQAVERWRIRYHENDDTGHFEYKGFVNNNNYYSVVGVGDYNSDNSSDFLVQPYCSYDINYVECDGAGNFTDMGVVIDRSDLKPRKIVSGKFDSDNTIDCLVLNASRTENSTVLFYSNDGQGIFTYNKTINIPSCASTEIIVGDFNNDTTIDFMVDNSTKLEYFSNDGTGNFTHIGNRSLGIDLSGKTIGAVDINADDILDVIVEYYIASNNKDLKSFVNDGTGNFTHKFQTDLPMNTNVDLIDGNFDGDTFPDILVKMRPSPADLGENEVQLFSTHLCLDPSLDVGDDGIDEWSYTGNFTEKVTIGDSNLTKPLKELFQDYIDTHQQNDMGVVEIPMVFTSDSLGTITLMNLNVTYTPIFTVRQNNITDNEIGISITSSSYNNTFYHNNFINNTHHVWDNSTINSWDNGYPCGGNYWDNYTGVDNNCTALQNVAPPDGIGDTDYIVNCSIVDNYPLMNQVIDGRFQRPPIRINNNSNFNISHGRGVTSGNGTEGNPWIIENFIINGASKGTCIYVGNTTEHFVIRNCYLHGSTGGSGLYNVNAGVYLYNAINGTIDDNKLTSCTHSGIHLRGSTNNTISNNTASSNTRGVYLYNSDDNAILDNDVSSGNTYGIVVQSSDDNTIADNVASSNTNLGIWLILAEDNVIKDNIINSNNYGIFLHGTSKYNTIENNTVTSNNYGIRLFVSSNNTIKNNTIKTNSQYGLYLVTSSNGNSIYHNSILNNTNQAYDNSNDNNWDNGYPSGGNYWSDYSGNDIYCGEDQDQIGSDSIGDSNYTSISGGSSVDEYPLMTPWLWTIRQPHDSIRIDNNTCFNSTNGVVAGDGTENNPWIIQNYVINGTNYGYCIYVGNTTDYFTVRNSHLHNASGLDSGQYFKNSNILLHNVTHAGFENNTILNASQEGIYLSDSDNCSIDNNTISGSSLYGIYLYDSENISIIFNTVESNTQHGIYMSNCNYNSITHNNLSSNSQSGMYLTSSDYNTVNNNILSSNAVYGLFLVISDSNIITENLFSSNDNYGLNLLIATFDNVVYHNNFINNTLDNTNQTYDMGSNNVWNSTYPYGGNYWSDYNGYDNYSGENQNETGSDGIGDTSHDKILGSADSEDYYPLMTAWDN